MTTERRIKAFCFRHLCWFQWAGVVCLGVIWLLQQFPDVFGGPVTDDSVCLLIYVVSLGLLFGAHHAEGKLTL